VALLDERPRALLEVAMAHRFARSWHFDEHSRRTRRFDYRVLADGQVFLFSEDDWDYATPEQRDLDQRALSRERRYQLDGKANEVVQHRAPGSRRSRMNVNRLSVPPEELRQPAPVFGDWLPLARLGDGWDELRATPDPDVAEPAPAPWQPPVPARPFDWAETFSPGTKVTLTDGMGTAVVEIQPAGILRLTSGRLVAADPYKLSTDTAPFTVTVAPGEYPVELAKVRHESGGASVAAAKVTISSEPVVSWQFALLPGQEPALLGEDEFYGFGVDTGLACLVDADALPAFGLRLADGEDPFDEPVDDLIDTPEPGSGANVIAFTSGWGDGSYPTWQGHAEDGTVAAFVVDLRIVIGDEISP
jgi:hypothetical protein